MKAIASGAKQRQTSDGHTVFTHLEWDVSGNCQKPVYMEYTSRPEGSPRVVIGPGLPRTWMFDMTVPCRSNCESCLKRRAQHWRFRAETEWSLAEATGHRTWLCTFTLNPTEQMRTLGMTRARLARGGTDFDALPAAEKLSERHRETGAMVTLALKRLRKGEIGVEGDSLDKQTWKHPPAEFRYMLVLEAHASGDPHYHMLVHETQNNISHRSLTRCWTAGFSNVKLVTDKRGASYAAKYLGKSASARVRASARYGYGETASAIASLAQRVKTATTTQGSRQSNEQM